MITASETSMPSSSSINRFTHWLFLDDHPGAGLFRLLMVVILPVGVSTLCAILFHRASLLIGKILILYFLGLISAFESAVAYIKDIYEQDYDHIPLRYFVACFFGLFPPQIKISDIIHDSPFQEMVEKIGGPAFLNIRSGFAVLTETLTAPANIYGQGKHFITRQERIYEIIDLHEQEGVITDITATTKDGIPITVENIKYNYRIWDSRWESLYKDRTIARNPFPYSKQAIHNYAYNRNVKLREGKSSLASWSNVVSSSIQGIIAGYINEHKFDDVIASREYEKRDPRDEIRKRAYEAAFQNSMRSVGTLLRWWDPGEFKSQKDVEDQFLFNWSIDYVSNAKLNRAYGEAQKIAYEELGRAEAEADLLTSIIHALDGIRFSADKKQTLQNLILVRTAQVIKAMTTPMQSDQSLKIPDQKAPTSDAKSK